AAVAGQRVGERAAVETAHVREAVVALTAAARAAADQARRHRPARFEERDVVEAVAAAVERVVAGAAREVVVAGAAGEGVVAPVPEEAVVAGVAGEGVGEVAAVQLLCAGEGVVAVTAGGAGGEAGGLARLA